MNLKTQNKINVTGGMNTMTDLVFLLLIFFIIISTLVSNGVNVDLPQSKGTTSVTSNLTLSIQADGTYHLNGDSRPMSREDLEPKLRLEMAKQDEKVVYLQVDTSVPTGQTVEIIGLAKANSWKVMLGANPSKQ
ncbi:MAG: biopolymer transporter ExbD [Flavobacteriales bacterium]|jgi:biopolymer transport protein ExbD|nr:biopolymer transporter ExbD [Flavobacteriales bacterium]|tara:strand:+ start:155 stop:556 length:402 start_codon:yes stop_codon:yes gene_type:complete